MFPCGGTSFWSVHCVCSAASHFCCFLPKQLGILRLCSGISSVLFHSRPYCWCHSAYIHQLFLVSAVKLDGSALCSALFSTHIQTLATVGSYSSVEECPVMGTLSIRTEVGTADCSTDENNREVLRTDVMQEQWPKMVHLHTWLQVWSKWLCLHVLFIWSVMQPMFLRAELTAKQKYSL